MIVCNYCKEEMEKTMFECHWKEKKYEHCDIKKEFCKPSCHVLHNAKQNGCTEETMNMIKKDLKESDERIKTMVDENNKKHAQKILEENKQKEAENDKLIAGLNTNNPSKI